MTPKKIEVIKQLLLKQHGRPASRALPDPLDQLIATILSQNTSDTNSDRAFENLKRKFPTWEAVLHAKAERVAEAIHCGGLAQIKSLRILRVLRTIVEKEGCLSLSRIATLPAGEAIAWLTDLDGVGIKTACCVLLFAWGKPVLPVDTHVYRITQRLGWLKGSTRIENAHEELHKLIAPVDRLAMHLLLIQHGRRICHALRPACIECSIARYCPSAKVDAGQTGAAV